MKKRTILTLLLCVMAMGLAFAGKVNISAQVSPFSVPMADTVLPESVTVSRVMTDHWILIWELISWSALMELIGMTSMAQPARNT